MQGREGRALSNKVATINREQVMEGLRDMKNMGLSLEGTGNS